MEKWLLGETSDSCTGVGNRWIKDELEHFIVPESKQVPKKKKKKKGERERSNQSILKEMDPEYSLEGLMLKLQYFGNLMQRAKSLEKTLMLGKIDGRRRRRQQRMRWLDSITNSVYMSLKKFQVIGKDREAWHAAVLGVENSQTQLSNWTTTKIPLRWGYVKGSQEPSKRVSNG